MTWMLVAQIAVLEAVTSSFIVVLIDRWRGRGR